MKKVCLLNLGFWFELNPTWCYQLSSYGFSMIDNTQSEL